MEFTSIAAVCVVCLLTLHLLPILKLFMSFILEMSCDTYRLPERNLNLGEPQGPSSTSAGFRLLSPKGLDPKIVQSLPTFIFAADSQKEGLDCAICLEGFKDKERGRELPGCHHRFHIGCIDMWFQTHCTCPICRLAVEPCHKSESQEQVLKKQSTNDAASSSAALDSSLPPREQFVSIPIGE
ncbi:RING-H2 finger protein [Nymphaea thermarum]|nr:RING-H2 finger protein [Nymphaea thermarum]